MESKTILFVEDDKFYREALVQVLESAGFSVEVAFDGAKGLEMLKTKTYGLVISDIMHPNLDGLQMLERYNELSKPKVPVWFLSNLTDNEDVKKQAESLGAEKTYLKSRVELDELVADVADFFSQQTQKDEDTEKLLDELLRGNENYLNYSLQFDHVKGLDDQKYLFIIEDDDRRGEFAAAYLDPRADITNDALEGVKMISAGKYKLVFSDTELQIPKGFKFWDKRDFLFLYESDEYHKKRSSAKSQATGAKKSDNFDDEGEEKKTLWSRFIGLFTLPD